MNEKMYDKIRGALYGVAVGDALGAPLEFMSADEITKRHGHVSKMIGGGWLNVKPGEVTDDTQMTICVAKGIIKNPDEPYEEIGEEFIKWYYSRPKDIGGTCSSSIYHALQCMKSRNAERPDTQEWLNAAIKTDEQMHGRSAGNGSLMRTVYPGLYYYELSKAVDIADTVSRMTHFDERATTICSLYTKIIWRMIHEHSIVRRLDHLFGETIKAGYYKAYEVGFMPNPSGYVVDSFLAAIYSINKAYTDETGFRGAIETAVNLGGDADTIGAITGGLAGALFGYGCIPTSWIEALSMKDKNTLDELALAAENNQEALNPEMKNLDGSMPHW